MRSESARTNIARISLEHDFDISFYFVLLGGAALFEFFIGAFAVHLIDGVIQLGGENLAVNQAKRHLDVKRFFSYGSGLRERSPEYPLPAKMIPVSNIQPTQRRLPNTTNFPSVRDVFQVGPYLHKFLAGNRAVPDA